MIKFDPNRTLILPPDDGKINSSQIYDVPLTEIFADEDFNCRGIIDPLDVEDLSRDIKQKGLIQPILLQPWSEEPGKKWRIIAGYRRFKAVRMLAIQEKNDSETVASGKFLFQTIQAIVKPGIGDYDARILNLSENLQRENLNIMQEAKAIEHFQLAGWSEQQVAAQLKMSRGWVQTRYMLLTLPSEIQDEVVAGMISQHQVRHLYSLETREQQFELAKKFKENKLNKNKREVNPDKVIKKNQVKVRNSLEEIFEIQAIIREYLGNGIGTKVLAWVAGEISDLDLHRYISEKAIEQGKFYAVPDLLNQAPRTMDQMLK